MKLSYIYSHLVNLLNLIENRKISQAENISTYFRNNRGIGSKERKKISELIYYYIRYMILIHFISDVCAKNSNSNDDNNLKALIIQLLSSCEDEINPNSKLVDLDNAFINDMFSTFRSFIDEATIKNHLNCILETFINIKYNLCEVYFTIYSDSKQLSIQHSFPIHIIQSVYDYYKFSFDDLSQFISAYNIKSKVNLRVNLNKNPREKVIKLFANEGIEAFPTQFSPAGIEFEGRHNLAASKYFKDSIIEIQDEGSQLISYALNPMPNTKILDACAGAGGKSLHIADITGDKAMIYAVDTSIDKLSELIKRKVQAGYKSINIPKLYKSYKPANDEFLNKTLFDYVLVDAPCSGTGTIRRNPFKKYEYTKAELDRFPIIQSDILKYYARFVKSGGTLLYATCSFLPEENFAIAENFLAENTDFIPGNIADGFDKFHIKLNYELEAPHIFNMLPTNFSSDTFFMAKFKKI